MYIYINSASKREQLIGIDTFFLQTFRHGFPYQPTALAFDPIQRLLAIGTKNGSLRMYPLYTHE